MTTNFLDFHQSLKQSFFQAFETRPHHAWILKGAKGVGKLDFAKQIAAKLLVAVTPDDHIQNKIENQNHPNFLYLSPEDSTAKTISIEQVRKIFHFLQQTSHDGGWKVVILNSLNTLTINGANGLLKILEAPPPRTIFFLIQHNGTPVLPTLVSRCAQLSFTPLSNEELSPLLPNNLSAQEQTLLLSLAQGCPNHLLDLLDQEALALYYSFQEAVQSILANNYNQAHHFAQTIGKDTIKLNLFLSLLEWWLQNAVKEIALHNRIFFKIECSLSSLLDIHQTISKIISWKKNFDLDGRQLILNIFFELKNLKV